MLAVAGCTGSLFKSNAPPPTQYQLTASPASSQVDIPVDLAVLTPRVRPGLDTDLIAALYSDRRLDYFAGARWSGPLDEVVQDLALQAFRARAKLKSLHTDESAFASGYWLELEVADFQAEYARSRAAGPGAPPVAHVHLLGRVGGSVDRRLLGQFEADERAPAADNRLAAIVEACNQAADAALAKIVEGTAETIATTRSAQNVANPPTSSAR